MSVLDQIMGVREAAARWSMPVQDIIRLCRDGSILAVQLDGAEGQWVLVKDQPHPLGSENMHRPNRTSADKASYMSTKLLDALYE